MGCRKLEYYGREALGETTKNLEVVYAKKGMRKKKCINYYPFGMQQPGRTYNSPSYRYGFNGEEKDDEIKGSSGTSLNYKFRMYDPRLGRFLAVDPVTSEFPFWTPYQFAGNMPIKFLDLEGLQPGQRAFEAGLAISNRDAYELEKEAQQASKKRTNVNLFQVPFTTFGEQSTAVSLIEHYGYGEGEDYELSYNELTTIIPKEFKGLSGFDFASVGTLEKYESRSFSMDYPVYASSGGTLGHFDLKVSGTIKRTNIGLVFDGVIEISEVFDFNASDHRHWIAEGQVTLARNMLIGVDFTAIGSVEVQQALGGEIRTKEGDKISSFEGQRGELLGPDQRDAGTVGTDIKN